MALDRTSFPMVEYQKAARLHWNPSEIDFSRDRADWLALASLEQDGIMTLSAQFLLGETAVAHDLAPLLIGIRQQGGQTEEEIFLATQLYEEARHTEFFDRWLVEVPQQSDNLSPYITPSYRVLFLERLPERLNACLEDPSTLNLALATVTYHMIVEGVMAETGYHIFAQAMKARNLFPGLQIGMRKIQQDEARHIAFGLYLIRRLVKEEPTIWPAVETTLNDGLMLALGSVTEAFARWEDKKPFDLSVNEAIDFASRQFTRRYMVLQR